MKEANDQQQSQTTTATSSTGAGSVGSSPRDNRWEQGSPSTSRSPSKTSQEKGKEAGRSPRAPDVLAQTQSSLSQLRVSQAELSSPSSIHTVQSNIGRSRSQSPDGGARSPISEPGSPGKPYQGHGDPDFDIWFQHSRKELDEAKRRAADTGSNSRRAQRVAVTESRKADAARLHAKTTDTKAKATRVVAMATIADNPKPKMIDRAHKAIWESGISNMEA